MYLILEIRHMVGMDLLIELRLSLKRYLMDIHIAEALDIFFGSDVWELLRITDHTQPE
jgi:hypothetical protein